MTIGIALVLTIAAIITGEKVLAAIAFGVSLYNLFHMED